MRVVQRKGGATVPFQSALGILQLGQLITGLLFNLKGKASQ